MYIGHKERGRHNPASYIARRYMLHVRACWSYIAVLISDVETSVWSMKPGKFNVIEVLCVLLVCGKSCTYCMDPRQVDRDCT